MTEPRVRSWAKDYIYKDSTIRWDSETPLVPTLTFPHHKLRDSKQFTKVRNTLYRSGEASYIRQFFREQGVPVSPDYDEFWIHVYGAVRVLTHKTVPSDMIHSQDRLVPPEDLTPSPEVPEPLLDWWSIACRAQFWLDRFGIKVIHHNGTYRRCGAIYTIPRKYYHAD